MASNQSNRKSYAKLAQLYNCYQPDYPILELVKKVWPKEGDINFKIPPNSSLRLSEPNLCGGTALHLAVFRNDIHTFENLLMNGADITIQNEQGRTALHCIFDYHDTLKNEILNIAFATHVSIGDPSNPCDIEGISHLHIACMKNHANAVEFFLSCGTSVDAAVNPDAIKYAGYTPLHFAADGCALTVIRLLLNHGANMSVKDARGMTPFHVLLNEKIKLINDLLSKQDDASMCIASIDSALNLLLGPDEIDDLGLTHFHIACAMQDTAVAEFFLANPQIQNSIDKQVKMDSPVFPGYTALHFAARCNLNMAKRLLMKQANLEVRDANGVTPMNLFWQKKKREELQAILDQNWKYAKFSQGPVLIDFINCMWDDEMLRDYLDGTELSLKMGDQPPCWTDRTLMHFAVLLCKNIETMKIFMEPQYEHKLKSQINAQDFYGSTPIHLAFRANKLDIVDLLMQNTDPTKNFVDKDGLSYLHIACATRKPQYVEHYCLHANNIQSICRGTYTHPLVKPGSTALHVAVASGDPRNIRALLRRGLNPLIKDANGETPLDRFLHLTKPAEGVCQAFLESDKVTSEVLEYIGLTRLHLAVYSNVSEIRTYKNSQSLRTVITCNDPKSFLCEYDGYTPLHMAFKRYATVECAQLLLKTDFDLLVKNARGECPLYTALSQYVRNDLKTSPDILDWIIDKLQYNSAMRRKLQEMSGITILHLVCYAVDVNAISWLMIGNVDVEASVKSDCPIWPGCTPLHMLMKAIRFHGPSEDIYKAASLMLENGADVSILNEDGDTPIHLALQNFTEKMTFRLVALLIANLQVFHINPSGMNGISHFHAACLVNNSTVVKEFLANGVDANEPVDFFAEYFPGQSPLHLAMVHKSSDDFSLDNEEEVVDWLLMHNADVTAEDNCGQTPFFKAITTLRDFLYWEKFVGNAPTTINTRNIYEQTPLEMCLRKQIVTPVEITFFADRGCRLDDSNPLTDEGYLSLMISNNHKSEDFQITINHKQCFDIMLKNAQSNCGSMSGTLIHKMVTTNSPNSKIFNFDGLNMRFQSIGFDVDVADRKGKTALHLAAKFGNEIAVKEFLKAGADVNIVDSENKTALECAVEYHAKVKYCPNKICHKKVMKCLASHVRTLESLSLVVSSKNTLAKSKVLESMSTDEKDSYEYYNNVNIDTIRITVSAEPIADTGLRIKDFLSENGKGIITYPFMTDMLREKVDKFFQNYDHQLKDVCMVQYRRTLNRVKMIKTAIDTIWSMANTPVPVVCIEMIFEHLTNDDLKNFLEGTSCFNNPRVIVVECMSVDE